MPVLAHMAGGADQALFVQSRFCLDGNGRRQTVGLLGQRRVAAETGLVLVARLRVHVDQLAEHARSHRFRMQRAAPVLELLHMAGAAGRRIERRFLRREMRRRHALVGKRALPMLVQKGCDILGGRHDGLRRRLRFGAGGEYPRNNSGH